MKKASSARLVQSQNHRIQGQMRPLAHLAWSPVYDRPLDTTQHLNPTTGITPKYDSPLETKLLCATGRKQGTQVHLSPCLTGPYPGIIKSIEPTVNAYKTDILCLYGTSYVLYESLNLKYWNRTYICIFSYWCVWNILIFLVHFGF